MAKDSEEFDAWLEEHGSRLPFAAAMGHYRRINTMLQKFRTVQRRTKEDGWMPYSLKYHGAHTGRWSGDAGFNGQNLPRDATFFSGGGVIEHPDVIEAAKTAVKKKEALPQGVAGYVDLRKRIVAPEGKVLVVCDLANIEPRVMAVLAGDGPTLNTLRTGVDMYEAHARSTMGYNDPRPLKDVDGELRRLAKARVLGLSYGCGWLKFVTFAKQMLPAKTYEAVFGAPVTAGQIRGFQQNLTKRLRDGRVLTEQFQKMPPKEKAYWVNSEGQVRGYRESNDAVTGLWAMLEELFRKSCGSKEFTLELPSGRVLRYRNPKNHGGLSAETPRMGKLMRVSYHGGVLTENLCQAVARDVFGDCALRLEAAGFPLILHAHDEAVCLVDEVTAEAARTAIEKIMSTPPAWMPTLPQAAEAHVCKVYTK
jgi:DNA polymerase